VEITADTVRGLAALARLELDDVQVERMRRDLAAMLDYVEQLSELDVSGVPPTAHVLDVATPFRTDDEVRRLPVEEVVRNAPRHDRGSYVVPKVIE
jgi:aspartyl-tRNA(Asn)/glutamyl-tRNA(Gln) amidotransferase subunit C